MRSSLEAAGAAPYHARHPPAMSGGVGRHHDLSGCGAGQELIQRLRGGLPPQGLAGPGVELGGHFFQVLPAVHGKVGALGEVLAQQPVGVLVAAALPGRVRVAEVDCPGPRPPRSGRGRTSRCPGPRSATGGWHRAARPSPPSSPPQPGPRRGVRPGRVRQDGPAGQLARTTAARAGRAAGPPALLRQGAPGLARPPHAARTEHQSPAQFRIEPFGQPRAGGPGPAAGRAHAAWWPAAHPALTRLPLLRAPRVAQPSETRTLSASSHTPRRCWKDPWYCRLASAPRLGHHPSADRISPHWRPSRLPPRIFRLQTMRGRARAYCERPA